MLIGGVPRESPDGARIRGEVHMLLVGDPGTGEQAGLGAGGGALGGGRDGGACGGEC